MRTLHFLALALPVLALTACNGEVVDPDDDPQGSADSATVEGRVDDQGRRAAVQGAVVTAYRIDADGSLIRIDDSATEVTTDASGSYSIDIQFDEGVDVMSDVVIRAESTTFGQAHTLVTGDVAVDSTVTAAAMDTETSLEAEIYIDARVDGDWDDSTMSVPMLRTMVGARTATAFDVVSDLDSQGSAELDVVTDAVLSSMVAFNTVLRGEAMSETSADADFDAVLDTMTELQASFDQASDAASTSAEANTAAQIMFDSMIGAYMEEGFTSSDLALGAHAAAEASLLFAEDMNEDIAAVFAGEMSEVRTMLAVDAMTDAFADLDLSSDTEAKGDTLLGDLQTTLDSSSSLMLDLNDLLGDFRSDFEADLLTELESSLSLSNMVAIRGLFDDISTSGTSLSTSIDATSTTSASGSGEGVGDAMTDFALDVQSTTNTAVLTANGFDASGASAMLELMTQINAFASYND